MKTTVKDLATALIGALALATTAVGHAQDTSKSAVLITPKIPEPP